MATQDDPKEDTTSGTDEDEDDDGFAEERLYRARPLAIDALDGVFELFDEEYGTHDNLSPREEFAQLMREYGVEFPEDSESKTRFRRGEPDAGAHVVLSMGQFGGQVTAVTTGMDYIRGFLGGEQDHNDGYRLVNYRENDNGRTEEAVRLLEALIGDTDDSKGTVRGSFPPNTGEFKKAVLSRYDSQLQGGAGNEALFSGLPMLMDDIEFLRWMLKEAVREDRSIVEFRGGLGGGSGSAQILLAVELLRLQLIGRDPTNVGFLLGGQLGRFHNDVELDVSLPNGDDRYTYHDQVAILDLVNDRLEAGDAAFAHYLPNPGLTFGYWATRAQAGYDVIRDHVDPIRQDADPLASHRDLADSTRFNNLQHSDRDRYLAEATFAWRRLVRREPWVKFTTGDEDYDPGDMYTGLFGSGGTIGYYDTPDPSEFENRSIPSVRGIDSVSEAIYANSRMASTLLVSEVTTDEIEAAFPVVFREDTKLTAGHLREAKRGVADELDLNMGDVRAIEMSLEDGHSRHPNEAEQSVTVFASHSLPLKAHERMVLPEYRRAVNEFKEGGL